MIKNWIYLNLIYNEILGWREFVTWTPSPTWSVAHLRDCSLIGKRSTNSLQVWFHVKLMSHVMQIKRSKIEPRAQRVILWLRLLLVKIAMDLNYFFLNIFKVESRDLNKYHIPKAYKRFTWIPRFLLFNKPVIIIILKDSKFLFFNKPLMISCKR